MTEREQWLAQVREDILEPDRPIIDPHHHLWRGDRPAPYLLEDLWADTTTGHRIEQTVFVECMAEYRTHGDEQLRPLGETEFVREQAEKSVQGPPGSPKIAAIVGFADLCRGESVGEVLDAHLDLAPDLFKGIRHAAGWDASDDIRNSHTDPIQHLYADEKFRAGFAQLAPRGMSFDAWNYHTQIAELADLARAFPQTTIVFDHFGGPLGIGPYQDRRSEIFARWKSDVTELAACENVVAKLGGLAMPINNFGWHKRARPASSDEIVAAHRDYYLHTLDAFGPDRCMFESNFPVDKQSVSYPVLWNAFKKIAAGFSEPEKQALFHDTAARVYRLGTV